MESASRRITWLVLAFLVLTACFYTQKLRLDQKMLVAQEADFRLAETTYMPPNEMVRVISLGYTTVMADLVFMEANNYFATHLGHDRKYRWLDVYVDALIGYCRGQFGNKEMLAPDECEAGGHEWIDGVFPFNPRVFLWSSQVIKFAPQLEDSIIDRSVYYGKTGIHFCPDNWEIYYDLGFNLYFEYRDLPEARRQQYKRKALDYFSVAANLPNSRVDPNFIASSLWSKDETERALRQIYQTYYHATDRQRTEIRSRVRAYGHKEIAELFEQGETSWRSQMPYVPFTLFQAVGDEVTSRERPSPRLREEWQ